MLCAIFQAKNVFFRYVIGSLSEICQKTVLNGHPLYSLYCEQLLTCGFLSRIRIHTVSLPPELFQLTPWLGGSLYVMNTPYYPILFRAGPQE